MWHNRNTEKVVTQLGSVQEDRYPSRGDEEERMENKKLDREMETKDQKNPNNNNKTQKNPEVCESQGRRKKVKIMETNGQSVPAAS